MFIKTGKNLIIDFFKYYNMNFQTEIVLPKMILRKHIKKKSNFLNKNK